MLTELAKMVRSMPSRSRAMASTKPSMGVPFSLRQQPAIKLSCSAAWMSTVAPAGTEVSTPQL